MGKILACCAVVSVAFLAGADSPEGDAADKKELKRFSGSWQAVSAVRDGKEAPKETAAKITLTVKGEKYTFKIPGGEAIEGTHKLDPSKKPKEIDAVRSTGKDKGEKILGIYELTKDTYKVCLAPPGKDRPTEFSSKEGSGHRLLTFKRAKE